MAPQVLFSIEINSSGLLIGPLSRFALVGRLLNVSQRLSVRWGKYFFWHFWLIRVFSSFNQQSYLHLGPPSACVFPYPFILIMTPLVGTWSSLLASLSRPCTIEVVHRLFDVQYSPFFFLLESVLNKNPLAVVSLLVDSNVCDCFCKPLLGTFRDHVYATHPTLQCWFVFLPI